MSSDARTYYRHALTHLCSPSCISSSTSDHRTSTELRPQLCSRWQFAICLLVLAEPRSTLCISEYVGSRVHHADAWGYIVERF